MKKIITLSIILLFTAMAFAQEDKEVKSVFKVDGEFRTRFEYMDGFGKLVAKDSKAQPQIQSSQRSRVSFCYHNSKVTSKISVQDVRMWGQDKTVINGTTPIVVYEAWSKYNFTPEFGLKVGRQELDYNEGIMLCNKNWNNYGATHDALVFQYEKGKNFKIHFGGAVNANSGIYNSTYDANLYKEMGFLYISKKFSFLTLNILDLFEGRENTDPTSTTVYGINTIGAYPVMNFLDDNLNINGSFYYQMGTAIGGDDIAAMTYLANASYDFGQVKLAAGYQSQSGEAWDDDQTDNTQKTFSRPYGAQHKFFGNMHYHLKNPEMMTRGLNDINATLTVVPKKGTSIAVKGHMLSYATTPADGQSKEIGTDVDLMLTHKFKGMKLIAGYSVFLPSTDFTTAKVGADTEARFANYAWVMLAFKPNFFTHKTFK